MAAHLQPVRLEHLAASRVGTAVLAVAIAVILAALAFEHLGGYPPCPLCLQERWAYYVGIPALIAALILLARGHHGAAALVFGAVALAFVANAGLGIYHAGAEWEFWPGPATCSGAQPISTGAGGLFKDLAKTNVIRCDKAPWVFLGLSFAGWNAVLSLALAAGAGLAGASARHGRG